MIKDSFVRGKTSQTPPRDWSASPRGGGLESKRLSGRLTSTKGTVYPTAEARNASVAILSSMESFFIL